MQSSLHVPREDSILSFDIALFSYVEEKKSSVLILGSWE